MTPLLETRDLDAGYGEVGVLSGVTVAFATGGITAVIGSNGAGKTTLMRALAGLLSPSAGSVWFDGEDVSRLEAHQRLARGLALVPEGRLVYPDFTIADTLRIGAYTPHARHGWRERVDEMYALFPRLHERRHHHAGSLSGGEQQMLALARGLMSRPRMLLLDEPSLGLAPTMAQEVYRSLRKVCEQGFTIGLVEQNVHAALDLADRAYVLEDGHVVMEGSAATLRDSAEVRSSYLGL